MAKKHLNILLYGAFITILLAASGQAYLNKYCIETTTYPDLKARPVLIQQVNPVTGEPYGDVRIGSPTGPKFEGASTEELGFVPAQTIKKWIC